MFVPIRIIIRQYFSQLSLLTNSEKNLLIWMWMWLQKGSLFSPSVLIWRKTRKRQPRTLSFIEEVWICRTGAIFQCFSVKRRQGRGEHESESRARRGVKKFKKSHKEHLYPFAHQDRKTTKNMLRIVNS